MSIIGYKVFNPDWTCRGFKYEVGKTYKHNGNIEMCGAGFHFCRKVSDCFNYYSFDSKNKIAKVEAIGLVETRDNKSVTDEIIILEELSWSEMLELANEGRDNSGLRNTGNRNTGNRNTGNWNTGDCNTGNRNTGDCNTGNRNTGNRNTGDCNTGNWNTGNRNTGNRNTGNRNTGNWNTGDCNTGNRNTGDCNTGNRNTGNRNTGDCNTGNWNTGNRNTGDCNTGNWNTGNWNTGDWNLSSSNTGFFATKPSNIQMFNKTTEFNSQDDIRCLKGMKALLWNYENSWWIYSKNMTEEEKEQYPEHETMGGYLKVVDHKTACRMMWNILDKDDRQAVLDLPNFDKGVFKEITGIDVEES